jgi:hypothetical protein
MKSIRYLIPLWFALVLAGGSPPLLAAGGKAELRHVVAFKFKEGTSPAKVDEIVTAFGGLKKKIRAIAKFEWGTNVSPEKRDKGFTHMFVLTYKSEKDRDNYLVHPAHQDFVKLVGPVLDDVFVIDYWARR